jgi:predicted metal-dependent hydrolase
MQISVLPDMTVEVVAPERATDSDILKRMNKRGPWICRQIKFFRQYHPRTPERRYLAAETHLYLGRRYRLKFFRALQTGIKLKGGHIEVHTHYPSRRKFVRHQSKNGSSHAHTNALNLDWQHVLQSSLSAIVTSHLALSSGNSNDVGAQ